MSLSIFQTCISLRETDSAQEYSVQAVAVKRDCAALILTFDAKMLQAAVFVTLGLSMLCTLQRVKRRGRQRTV